MPVPLLLVPRLPPGSPSSSFVPQDKSGQAGQGGATKKGQAELGLKAGKVVSPLKGLG